MGAGKCHPLSPWMSGRTNECRVGARAAPLAWLLFLNADSVEAGRLVCAHAYFIGLTRTASQTARKAIAPAALAF